MNLPEFSAQFDVLYNNITSNQAPGLNEYEKSVFLTKGEFQLVNEYFNSRTDGVGGGFDGSQKRQYDFSSLIKVTSPYYVGHIHQTIDKRSLVYLFPNDFYLAVNEALSDGALQYSVLPISYSEYQRLMLKPYAFPVKRSAWRLLSDRRKGYESANVYSKDGYYFACSYINKGLILNIKMLYDSTLSDQSTTSSETWEANEGSLEHPIIFKTSDTFDNNGVKIATIIKIEVSSTEQDTVSTYHLNCRCNAPSYNDASVIKWIQEAFGTLKNTYQRNATSQDSELVTICKTLNWLERAYAPTDKSNFNTVDGKELQTTMQDVETEHTFPSVEIIGKFKSSPEYQLRYIKKPAPIILDDLRDYGEDITIEREYKPTECELPEATHQEILERAVTLAKIAWAGGTATQAAAQQREN